MSLVTSLINKLEENVIRMELLANYLPLSISAQERKKALVSFCKNQCCENSNLVKLVFDNPGFEAPIDLRHVKAQQLQDTSSPDDQPSPCIPDSHITPDAPLSGNTDTKFHFANEPSQLCSKSSKKKKGKAKKNRRKGKNGNDTPSCISRDPHQPKPTATANEQPAETIKNEDQQAEDMPHKYHLAKDECNNCSELRTAMTVLQDSIIDLKEEVLQQKVSLT